MIIIIRKELLSVITLMTFSDKLGYMLPEINCRIADNKNAIVNFVNIKPSQQNKTVLMK